MAIAWLLGTTGIAAIEASYVPQILRLWRLKTAAEVSYLFPSLNLVGRILALTYSLLSSNQVFFIGFAVGAVLRGTLLAQVVWYRHARPSMARLPIVKRPPQASQVSS